MNILEKIVAAKKPVIENLKIEKPVSQLEKSIFFERESLSFPGSIWVKQPGIIAEFKRKSPSKPKINLSANSEEVVLEYEQAGASALSILTEEIFFGGSQDDIFAVRDQVQIPILRKDFIFDEYQVIESKSMGADAILLIAAILTKKEIKKFTDLAVSLGLSVLLEIHEQNELKKLYKGIDVVGVNNRNLKTFEVNLDTSLQLVDKIPAEFVKISESGIKNPIDLEILAQAGYQGFLIGESFMKTKNPARELNYWIQQLI